MNIKLNHWTDRAAQITLSEEQCDSNHKEQTESTQ